MPSFQASKSEDLQRLAQMLLLCQPLARQYVRRHSIMACSHHLSKPGSPYKKGSRRIKVMQENEIIAEMRVEKTDKRWMYEAWSMSPSLR